MHVQHISSHYIWAFHVCFCPFITDFMCVCMCAQWEREWAMSVSVLTEITHITQSYTPREELNGFRRPMRSLLVVDDVTFCSASECSSHFYTGSGCKSQVSCKVFHSQQNYKKVTALNSKTTVSSGINYQLTLAEATYICMNETQHDIHCPPA